MSRSSRYLWPVLGVCAAVLVADLALRRISMYENTFESGYGLIFTPGTVVQNWRENRAVSSWTEHGIRGSRRGSALEHGVLVLGDSFTEALMTPEERVFTVRAEAMLASAGLVVPILNSGRSGASLADHVAFARRHHETFHPRWVIVVVTDDDFLADAWDSSRTHFVRNPDGSLGYQLVLPDETGLAKRVLKSTRRWSALPSFVVTRVKELAAGLRAEPPLFRAGSPPRVSATSGEYPVRDEVQMLASAYGGRASILYLGAMDPRNPLGSTSTEELVRHACAEFGIGFVTPRPLYPGLLERGMAPFGYPDMPWNTGHMNDAGHAIVAQVLATEIRRLADSGLL